MCQYEAHCIPQCFCCDFFACDCRMQCPEVSRPADLFLKPFHGSNWGKNEQTCLPSRQPICLGFTFHTEKCQNVVVDRYLHWGCCAETEPSEFVIFNIQNLFMFSVVLCLSLLGPWGDNILMLELKIFWHISTQKCFNLSIRRSFLCLSETHVSSWFVLNAKNVWQIVLRWLI